MQGDGFTEHERTVSFAERDDPTLAPLVASIAAGDQNALAALFDRCFDRVYQIARRIVRDDADAEEVGVEVFHQVWRTAATFDPARGSAWSWLASMAWSRAIDRRRRRRAAEATLVLHPEDGGKSYTHREDPLQQRWFEALEANRSLREAVECLTAAQRTVLGLAYFEGLSHAEIAAETGLALGTVKSHVRRGLEALRVQLDGGAKGPKRSVASDHVSCPDGVRDVG